jgi:hypothetical protein
MLVIDIEAGLWERLKSEPALLPAILMAEDARASLHFSDEQEFRSARAKLTALDVADRCRFRTFHSV